ncbi:4,5-DOPA dioxygenase extradiol [Paraburkholderia fungorum]|uniref:4,5-DOPA dioxygenase extradiol n=1 Tax=Paraburkholderia fungorum TaxID=134537 RepID=A0A1H1JMH4_9BURK|nr:4,5-DOPA dioxygenase extradiol [Paraburkholderia fungorum]SDR51120.1 4,5-DOPA dioxygenase extradiol [Paraburkholderia fungorum]
MSTNHTRMPVMFFGHGSPMNALEDNRATRAWASMGAAAGTPRAILMISAHWLTRGTAVTAMSQPRTIHDFGAFPPALFAQQYPAPGDPALASRVAELLAPLPVTLDDRWGFDHGTWSVLGKAFPDARIPVVQVGMNRSCDARCHYELGRALRPLRDEGVLIAASGNIVHNLPAMDWSKPDSGYAWAQTFHDRIANAIAGNRPDEVIDYEKAGAIALHSVPTPDHYWPVLYALGARHDDDDVSFESNFLEYGSLSMLSFILGKRSGSGLQEAA